jgi:15-cis-phytoene synthase
MEEKTMTAISNETWELSLHSLAQEAYHSVVPARHQQNNDQAALQQAYAHCRALTSFHSRSFFMASNLLKGDQRQAIRALYAFCRTADDIVDDTAGNSGERLRAWRDEVLSWHPPAADLVATAWADTRARYHVPQRYAEQLIDGVARDLVQSRYQNFDDLATYCYGAASTVGLMSMHIIGYESDEAMGYAIKLGVALQLTNILRDVAEDWRRGRFYLPQDELAAFGLSDGDIASGATSGQYDDRWRSFMAFQIERARRLYDEAWPGIGLLNAEGRLAIAAAAGFYRAILDDIEAHDYDVFSRRARVSTWGKIRRLPAFWWRARRAGSQAVITRRLPKAEFLEAGS